MLAFASSGIAIVELVAERLSASAADAMETVSGLVTDGSKADGDAGAFDADAEPNEKLGVVPNFGAPKAEAVDCALKGDALLNGLVEGVPNEKPVDAGVAVD